MANSTVNTTRRIPPNAIHELKMGPYVGGINRYSDPSVLADSEMVDCVNFDIDLDGSLKSRPPWRTLLKVETDGAKTKSFQMVIGTYTYNSAQVVFYLNEVSDPTTGNLSWSTNYYWITGPSGGTFGLVRAGYCTKTVRYGNIVYFIPHPSNADDNGTSFHLDGSVGPASVPLKRGYSATIYKDRLWITGRRGISNESRVFFSDPGNPASFPGTNFFDISPGDGEAAQDLIVYQDNLVIFKDSSTYVLTFDSNPAQAVLQLINSDVGVYGPRCILPYENSIFVLQYNAVYEMVNYDFTRVSVKVPFELDNTLPDASGSYNWRDPIWMSRIGDRLIVRFYNRLYVYHLRLRAWTRWESNDKSIQYIGYIMLVDNTDVSNRFGCSQYVASSSLDAHWDTKNFAYIPYLSGQTWASFQKIFILDDQYEGTYTECGDSTRWPSDISCSMVTKAFDFGFSHRFKRLVHWGIDIITGRDAVGSAFPISLAYKPTWAQLSSTNWHDLGRWDFPTFNGFDSVAEQPSGLKVERRFARFLKSFRFRLVQFKIDLTTVGNTTDGPARIYSVTAFISAKQVTPKAVN